MKDVLVAQGGVRFQKLTPGDCAAIHRASLRLLARVGVEVHHERARKVLEAAGAAVEGTRVRSETPNILDHRTGLRRPGTLEDVREGARVVDALLATYEADISEAPVGQPFQELYDVRKAVPKPEYYDRYAGIKEELHGMGWSSCIRMTDTAGDRPVVASPVSGRRADAKRPRCGTPRPGPLTPTAAGRRLCRVRRRSRLPGRSVH